MTSPVEADHPDVVQARKRAWRILIGGMALSIAVSALVALSMLYTGYIDEAEARVIGRVLIAAGCFLTARRCWTVSRRAAGHFEAHRIWLVAVCMSVATGISSDSVWRTIARSTGIVVQAPTWLPSFWMDFLSNLAASVGYLLILGACYAVAWLALRHVDARDATRNAETST